LEDKGLGIFNMIKKEVKVFYDGWTEEDWYESKK